MQDAPAESGVKALKRVKDTIRRRSVLAVMAAIFLIATLLLGGALMLDAPIYLTADQAIKSVEALEDGTIRIHPTNIVVTTGSCVGLEENNSYASFKSIVLSFIIYFLPSGFKREFSGLKVNVGDIQFTRHQPRKQGVS